MPDTELVSARLAPNGDRLLTPPLGDSARYAYRLTLEGVFTFGYSGEAFDALYRSGPDGPFTRRHAFLQWTPRAPVLEREERERHRYVFRLPPEWKLDGQSVGVRVDVDRFVDEYLIPPSEVRGALSGDIRLTALQTPLAAPFPWPLVASISAPTALAVGGAALVIRRRMALAGLSPDLQETLVRIERKHRAARAAARAQKAGWSAVGGRLDSVREGAVTLIRRIQSLHDAQRLADRPSLKADIEALTARLAVTTDEAARRDGGIALEEKRKTLALLEEADAAESRCMMRLAKIEAVLDTAGLTLRSIRLEAPSAPAEEALRTELEAEVAAIREVAREVSACAALTVRS